MSVKLKPIAEQVVVLFGASSGIGREAALAFAGRGARVVVAARDPEGLETLVQEIRGQGGQAVAAPADAMNFEQVKAVADRAVAEYGRLDTWVHLAAVSVYASMAETTPDEFKHVIDVNLTGQAYGVMAALPYLKQSGGALICISSVEGEVAFPLHAAYAASKHGVEGMIESLRVELMHEGAPVSITSIKPASINTPFFEKARTRLGVQPRGVPPVYQPGVVVDAILYAAEHPTPEVVAGGAGKMVILMERLAPRFTDAVLGRFAYKAQHSDRPKSAQAPDSLYVPLAGYARSEGNQTAEAKSFSVYTWLTTHPAARAALTGVTMGAVALAAALALRDGE